MFKTIIRTINGALQKLILTLIRIYRYCFSPWLKPCCRFYPSCSQYAEQAVQDNGWFFGIYFTVRRLLRCHPFHSGGYDPAPMKRVKHG